MQDVPSEECYYPYAKKFFKPHALHGNHGVNWPIYRYSEVLLFLAEALNEQGKNDEAVQYLDMVRERAGLSEATGDLKEAIRSEEHTSELQSRGHLVCRLLLEKNKTMRPET